MRRALPPVGVHSTAEQLLQTTTVWLWLKTVVLQIPNKSMVSTGAQKLLHLQQMVRSKTVGQLQQCSGQAGLWK